MEFTLGKRAFDYDMMTLIGDMVKHPAGKEFFERHLDDIFDGIIASGIAAHVAGDALEKMPHGIGNVRPVDSDTVHVFAKRPGLRVGTIDKSIKRKGVTHMHRRMEYKT